MNRYLTEGIGAFFLVMTIAFSANPLAIGIMLMALVYMGGYISGAHYNPAVTLAVWLQKKIDSRDAVFYILFQFIGAILGCLLFTYVNHAQFIVSPGVAYKFADALLGEIFFTFALVSVVLHTAVSKKNTPNQFYGLAIGATVMAGAFSVGAVSGGAFNPAVGIAPILVNIANIQQSGSHFILYLLGPIIGSVLASFVYTYTTHHEK